MIREIKDLDDVFKVIDNEKATFYSGNSNEKDEITRDTVRNMSPTQVRKLITEKLIVKISR